MTDINELISDKIAQIKDIKAKISSYEGEAKPVEPTFKEVGSDEMLSQQYRSAAQAMLKSNPEKAMELFAKAEQISASKAQKEASQKDKVTGLLNEVASDFANIDPNNQASWTQAKDRWLQINPDLDQFIPSMASQDNWDRIQSQGGKGSNVAPKGEFAKKKKLENDITRYNILAQNALNAKMPVEANEYTKKAIELQKQLDGDIKTGETKTVEQIVADYQPQIDKLKASTGQFETANPSALFAEISKLYSGAVLDSIKENINAQLQSKKEAKKEATGYSDDQLKTIASQYKSQADALVTVISKIKAAKALLDRNITSGASAISAKALQQDVLAEAEFNRYGAKDVGTQWTNLVKSKIGLMPEVPIENAKDLISSLIDVYNSEAQGYIDVTKDNKFANKQVKLLNNIFATGGKDTNKAPKKGDTKTVYGIKMTYNGTNWE